MQRPKETTIVAGICGDADLLAGRGERFAEIAAEFVRLKVDVILTHNTPPALAAKQATSVIGLA